MGEVDEEETVALVSEEEKKLESGFHFRRPFNGNKRNNNRAFHILQIIQNR